MAPTAAVISSAEVASKANTYRLKIRAARPCDVAAVLALAASQTDGLPDDRVADGEHQQAAEADARRGRPRTRWPLIVSTSESAVSTPTSISTKRNSIKIAPV